MGRKNNARSQRRSNGSQRESQTLVQSEANERKPNSQSTGSDDGSREENEGGDMLGLAQFSARHPVTAVVGSFGIGLGLGVLLTAIFSQKKDESWLERHHLPNSMHDLTASLKRLPSRIAQQLPDSLMNR